MAHIDGEPHGIEQPGGVYTPSPASPGAPPPVTPPPPPAGPPPPATLDWQDPTQGSAAVGSGQWYAQLGQDPSNLEQMLEQATGKNITSDWLEDYGSFLPTYDPTGEQFAEGRYSAAEERYGLAGEAYGTAGKQYGLAKEGYQQQLGSIFDQAGTGTMDLMSSWGGGGQTMTGRKGRQRKGIGRQAGRQAAGARGGLKQAGLQYEGAGQAYAGAGITLGEAGITRAADIYGRREDYARELRGQITSLSEQEAFTDLSTMSSFDPSIYTPTNTSNATWSNPSGTNNMVWDSSKNEFVNPNASPPPLPLGP